MDSKLSTLSETQCVNAPTPRSYILLSNPFTISMYGDVSNYMTDQ